MSFSIAYYLSGFVSLVLAMGMITTGGQWIISGQILAVLAAVFFVKGDLCDIRKLLKDKHGNQDN